MRQLSRMSRLLAAATAAGTVLLGISVGPSQAAPMPVTPAPVAAGPQQPSGSSSEVPGSPFADPESPGAPQSGRLTAAQLPLVNPLSVTAPVETGPDKGLAKAAPRALAAGPVTAQSCTPADFAGRTGAALVSYVKASTPQCIGSLFLLGGSPYASALFRQSQMATMADAFQSAAASYPGDNSAATWQVVLYLRAGYYVQDRDLAHVGPYDATLTAAVTRGIDAFLAGPHAADVTDANGQVANDVIILTDSAGQQGRYLNTYRQVLNGYTSAYDSSKNLLTYVNSALAALDRGHENKSFVDAVTADPGIIDTLDAFTRTHHDLLGTYPGFLVSNAGIELTRFVKYPAFQARIRPLAKALLDSSSMTGPTAPLWVGTANAAAFFDKDQCSYYGVCDLKQRLTKAVLPIRQTCNATLTVLAQDLTAAELAAVCADLKGEDAYFHNLVRDNGPIPGQYESSVQLVVFASQADYQTYAGAMYEANTNNGGVTLTGTPTDPANQPVSLMYRHPNENGFTARIWNLNHEYAHVLDARYDMKGDFYQQTSVPDLWWIEGVAEYVSYTYRGVTDANAVTQAPKHTYPLSTLLQSTYLNSDVVRTYHWGYLAARYMIERYPGVVQTMLGYFRTGDYARAYAYYNGIGTAYDADFTRWVDTCAADTCLTAGTPKAAFDVAVRDLNVQLTDRSTETAGKGSITGWAWNFGDGTTGTAASPSKSYRAAGTYTVTLTVTDSNGKTATTTRTVTVTAPAAPAACTDPDARKLDYNCFRTGRSADAGSSDMMYIYMPAGTTTLTVSTTGGTGTAYLYYSPDRWASNTDYAASSTNSGTTQTVTVTNTTAGYRYITLYGKTAFSGVTVTTQY
ncbi:collagenase [Kitasatospora sp. NPDC048407]|uniref:collagenase n=1 Tax=Kitasatospora sp. NPDC048407 TaxID=3364051 RepID=UPI003714EE85